LPPVIGAASGLLARRVVPQAAIVGRAGPALRLGLAPGRQRVRARDREPLTLGVVAGGLNGGDKRGEAAQRPLGRPLLALLATGQNTLGKA
jgi:hypothetical protein